MATAPTSSSPTDGLGRAALIGVVAGIRSATPFGALAARGRIARGKRSHQLVLAATAGELVGDKLPMAPPRTDPGALGGRIASGAIAGTFLGGLAGTAAGAAGALVGTYASYALRATLTERLPLSPTVVALLEDALALGLAAVATADAG